MIFGGLEASYDISTDKSVSTNDCSTAACGGAVTNSLKCDTVRLSKKLTHIKNLNLYLNCIHFAIPFNVGNSRLNLAYSKLIANLHLEPV